MLNLLRTIKRINLLRPQLNYNYFCTMSKPILGGFPRIGVNNYEEVQFKMPWGHLAGKWWGDKSYPFTIIALHDWQQNASAFDKIIPELEVPSVLAIDLPGHGNSPSLKKSSIVHPHDLLMVMRRIVQKLPSVKCSFIGHGYGSTLAELYSALYNFQVDVIVTIESSTNVLTHLWNTFPTGFTEAADLHLALENAPKETYTIEEYTQKKKTQLSNRITDESAGLLIRREILDKGNDIYERISDPRTCIQPICKYNDENMIEIVERIRGKYLSIWNTRDNDEMPNENSKKNPYFAMGRYDLIAQKGIQNVLKDHKRTMTKVRESARYMEEVEIRSDNHLLLDDKYSIVAGVINNFLQNDIKISHYKDNV